jgi:hypothetical protein
MFRTECNIFRARVRQALDGKSSATKEILARRLAITCEDIRQEVKRGRSDLWLVDEGPNGIMVMVSLKLLHNRLGRPQSPVMGDYAAGLLHSRVAAA